MAKQWCQRTQLWLAERAHTQVVAPQTNELEQHLARCERCQRHAAVASKVAGILRGAPLAKELDLERGWQRLRFSTDATVRSARPRRWSLRRRELGWAGGLALALTSVAAAVVILRSSKEPRPAAPRPVARAAPEVREDQRPTKKVSLRAQEPPATNDTSFALARIIDFIGPQRGRPSAPMLQPGAAIAPSQPIEPGRRQDLVLRVAHYVVVAQRRSRLVLRRDTRIAAGIRLGLEQGTIVVSSLAPHRQRADGNRLSVGVGGLEVTPVGTVFAVTRRGQDRVRVAVLEGRVDIASSTARAELRAGQAIGDHFNAAPMSGAERRHLAQLAHRARHLALAEAAEETAGPARRVQPTPAAAASGLDHRRRATARAEPALAPERKAAPGADVPEQARSEDRATPARGSTLGSIDPSRSIDWARAVAKVERTLLERRSRYTRQQAQALLERDDIPSGTATLLRTLIAEALTQERRYREARDAYLAIAERTPSQHPLAAHAIYMAASLELEQLEEPALAARRLAVYLERFPDGSQREAAYLLRWRAFVERGDRASALRAARAYLREFPRGHHVANFARELELEQR